MENEKSKKVWTEEERLQLAASMDAGLEDYINKLEKKTYTEGWPEDRWQEEMEKHPFFMRKAPEPWEELSPLMEGLQQLKYGEDYNTPEELANNFKEDGNFNYKHKKYRMAIISYTEGIKTKCEDQELISQLHNNRAACHYMLNNYRSCLNDCKLALKLNPCYVKCLKRAADCCFHINDYDQCIELCQRILAIVPNDETTSVLVKQAVKSKKQLKRDKRKESKAEKHARLKHEKIFSAIKSRGITVVSYCGKEATKWEDLLPSYDISSTVYLKDNKLFWPVTFSFPELQENIFVTDFNEDVIILEMLYHVFKDSQEWDTKGQYTIDNVKVMFAEKEYAPLVPVDITQTLGTILASKGFAVMCGTPLFWVFPKQLFQPEALPRLTEIYNQMKVLARQYQMSQINHDVM